MDHDDKNNELDFVLKIRLIQAIVLSAFLVTGVGLFATISAFQVDWYLPTLAYGVAFFLSWKKFFGRWERTYKRFRH